MRDCELFFCLFTYCYEETCFIDFYRVGEVACSIPDLWDAMPDDYRHPRNVCRLQIPCEGQTRRAQAWMRGPSFLFFSFYTYRQSTSLRNNVITVYARRLRYVAVIALTVDLCRGRTSRDCAHGTPRSPNCVVSFAVGSTHIYKRELDSMWIVVDNLRTA